MDRRDFLLASGSAAIAGAALAAPLTLSSANAQTLPAMGARPLAVSVTDASGFSWTVASARELALRIEQASAHRFAVTLAGPTATSPEAKVTPALNLVRASNLVEIDKAFAFATGLPGATALDAAAVDSWLTDAGGQTALDSLAAMHGLKVLLAAHGGESFLWSTQPFLKPADFAGKCVQADGLGSYVAAGLGAEPWRIVSNNTTELLATGEVAAVEASVLDAMAQGILRPAHFAAANMLVPHGNALALTMNLDVWQAMTTADQTAISTAARETYRQSVRANQALAAMNRSALEQSYAIAISPAPLSLTGAIETVSRAVVAQTASSSAAAAKLNASYMSFLQQRNEAGSPAAI